MLTVDVSPGGSGTIKVNSIAVDSYPTVLTFANGESVRIEAVPNSGYKFASWNGSFSGTINTTTIVIDNNKTIIANFSQIMHTLTIEVNGSGSTTPTAGKYNYPEGTEISIIATPDNGWQFDKWIGDIDELQSANTMIIINSDKTVAAKFSQITHTLTIEVSGSGSTTPTVGDHNYPEGTEISITATPDNGWQFDNWTGDAAETELTTIMVTMDSNKTITANFFQIKTSWWQIVSIIAGVIVIIIIIWLVVKRRLGTS